MQIWLKKSYFLIRGLFLLSLSPFIRQRKIPDMDYEKMKRILIIRMGGLGDLVLSTPLFKAVKKGFPESRLTLLTESRNELSIKDALPDIDEIIIKRKRGILALRFVRWLRKNGFQLVIDLTGDYSLMPALLAYLSGAKIRAGFDVEKRGIFFNIRVIPGKEEKHIAEQKLELADAIGIDAVDRMPHLEVTPQADVHIETLLKKKGIEESGFLVGMHPGGSYPSQCWMLEGFIQVGQKIGEKYDAVVVIIIGPDEKDLIRKISPQLGKKIFIVSEPTIIEMIALISRCNLLICNNSGPLHIATAVGTPAVSMMGPTNPVYWWPMGDKNIVIRKDLPCSPCNKRICREHKCMRLITVEEVMEAVDTMLSKFPKKE